MEYFVCLFVSEAPVGLVMTAVLMCYSGDSDASGCAEGNEHSVLKVVSSLPQA